MLTVVHADCVDWMRRQESESVQLVVTSPPYDDLRTYGGYTFDFENTAREIHRILCDGGICCWNVNDSVKDGSETLTSCKQKIFFREQCGFRIHDTMIYAKSNFGHPEQTRYHQLFEYVFVLSKGKPRCFNPIKDKPNTWAGSGTFGRNSVREANGDMSLRKRNIIAPFGMRGNVWHGKTRGQEELCNGSDHPAKMPHWLARDLIRSWSNPGDTVLDPMAGSGTVGLEAIAIGREAICVDCNLEYVALMEQPHAPMGLGLIE